MLAIIKAVLRDVRIQTLILIGWKKELLHKQIRDFFVRNFDVRQEKEDELETIESIRKGIEFKGRTFGF